LGFTPLLKVDRYLFCHHSRFGQHDVGQHRELLRPSQDPEGLAQGGVRVCSRQPGGLAVLGWRGVPGQGQDHLCKCLFVSAFLQIGGGGVITSVEKSFVSVCGNFVPTPARFKNRIGGVLQEDKLFFDAEPPSVGQYAHPADVWL